MRILLLGGTAWLGAEIAAQARDAGEEVVAAARGESGSAPDGVRLVTVDRDRDDGLAALGHERWDAVVDLSRQPGHARRAARDLAPVADHVVLVSSGSVYAEHAASFQDETAQTLEPLEADSYDDLELYGRAKVAAEQAWQGATDGRAALVRAGLIGGPGDHTDRTGYYPWRLAHPSNSEGAVLVPDVDQLTSVLDVRDLAAWVLELARSRTGGVFDALGEPTTLTDHLAAVGSGANLVAASPGWLTAHDVDPWMGPRSLPLWLPEEMVGMNARSSARALSAGLVRRPLEATLADSRAWQEGRTNRKSGLTDDDERALLAALG